MTKKELLQKIDFEAKWLFDCGVYVNEVDIAFHAIKHFVIAFEYSMEDLISRQDAIKVCDDYYSITNIKNKIKELPSVNPQPKTGHWIAQDIHNCHTNFKCSECDYIHSFMHLYGKPTADYTYCPNCGARMVES